MTWPKQLQSRCTRLVVASLLLVLGSCTQTQSTSRRAPAPSSSILPPSLTPAQPPASSGREWNKLPQGIKDGAAVTGAIQEAFSPADSAARGSTRNEASSPNAGTPGVRPQASGLRGSKLQGATSLDRPVSSKDLQSLDLTTYKQPQEGNVESGATRVLGCLGAVCPQFEPCADAVITSCHVASLQDDGSPPEASVMTQSLGCPALGNSSSDHIFYPSCKLAADDRDGVQWAPQVQVLKNVYLTSAGSVFNFSHRFYPGGCVHDPQLHPPFDFVNGKRVIQVPRVVNLAIGQHGRHSLYEMVERLPLFVALAPIMETLAGNTRLFLGDSQHLGPVLGSVLGCTTKAHAIHLEKGGLILASVLYQPLHQPCTVASPQVWSFLRQRLLLPKAAQPMFDQEWKLLQALPASPPKPSQVQSLREDWAVVLGTPPSCHPLSLKNDLASDYKGGASIESLVMNNFWWGRVETYGWMKEESTRALFRRTALYITTPGGGLGNMVFMPRGSAVLLLERAQVPDSGGSSHSGTSALVRSLARACGLKLTTVVCEQGLTAEGALHCSMRSLSEALDWAATYLFHSPLLPEARALQTLGSRIPGSSLGSPAEVQWFRKWAKCVSTRGQWVLDPTPRPLPWMHHGGVDRCDHTPEDKNAIAASRADDVARSPRPDPAAWRVRDSVKYRWEVSPSDCPLSTPLPAPAYQRFSRDSFCQMAQEGMRITLLGDSIQAQMAEALVQNVLLGIPKPSPSFKFVTIKECRDWLGQADPPHQFCLLGEFTGNLCPGLVVEFMRNDLLEVYTEGAPVFDRIPFAQLLKTHLKGSDVIIFNRGPHYVPEELFVPELPKPVYIFYSSPCIGTAHALYIGSFQQLIP